MRVCDTCGQFVCVCAPLRQDAPETPRAYKPAPKYDYSNAITKEEFGIDLFNCIKAFSGRNWARECAIRDQTNPYIQESARAKALARWKKHEADCETQAQALLEQLTPTEQRQVLRRFESLAPALISLS